MSATVNKILYLGDDAAYFRVLSAEIKRQQGSTPVQLEQIFETTSKRIQGLLPKIMAKSPSIIIVDFSKQTDDYVHLSRLLIRSNTVKPFSVIGLHDYLSPPDQVKESFLTGVTMNFIKSAEVFDPAFAALVMLTPATKREHGFATGALDEEKTVFHLSKLGFVDAEKIHFETNLSLSPGEKLRIHNHWHTKKIVHSNLVKVTNSNSTLLFYHFKYGIDSNFMWVDPVVTTADDTKERIAELKTEFEHMTIKSKKALKSWIEDNSDRSQNKSVRVLVVDKSYSFFQDRERTDQYGYAIRCQPFLLDIPHELEAQRPQVIAFSIDIPIEGEKNESSEPANNLATVQAIADFCRTKMADNLPYLVIFNMKELNSKELQQQINYPNTMAFSGEIGPDVLLKMAGVFADKINKIKPKEPAKNPAPAAVYIKKSNPISIIEIEEHIKLEKLSETDVVFTCQRELPAGCVLHFKEPLNGYITITPHSQYSKHPSYYGLINGLGETEKKDLRVLINKLFFKDHDATKLVELEAYQQLNDAKLQEKQRVEEERIKAEVAAKVEAERIAKEKEEKATSEAQAIIEPESDKEEDEKKVSNG